MSDKKNILKKELRIKRKVVHYPDKTTINLVQNESGRQNRKSLSFFGVFVVFLLIFAKFAVLNPMKKVHDAGIFYENQKSVLMDLKESNKDFYEVKKNFEAVSGLDMDSEEMFEIDKYEALLMIQEDVLSYVGIKSLDISGENISISTKEMPLSNVSDMLLKLQNDDRNAFVSIGTTNSVGGKGDMVVTNIKIQYGNDVKGDEDNA